MSDKVARQWPQTATFEVRKRAEVESNQGPSVYQPNALPLGQTVSLSQLSLGPPSHSAPLFQVIHGTTVVDGCVRLMTAVVFLLTPSSVNKQVKFTSIRKTPHEHNNKDPSRLTGHSHLACEYNTKYTNIRRDILSFLLFVRVRLNPKRPRRPDRSQPCPRLQTSSARPAVHSSGRGVNECTHFSQTMNQTSNHIEPSPNEAVY